MLKAPVRFVVRVLVKRVGVMLWMGGGGVSLRAGAKGMRYYQPPSSVW